MASPAPPERLLTGLGSLLCRGVAEFNAALMIPSKRAPIAGASIDVEGLRHLEPGSVNGARSARVDGWTVRLETERLDGPASSGGGDEGGPRREGRLRRLRVRAELRWHAECAEPAFAIPIDTRTGHDAWLSVRSDAAIDDAASAFAALADRLGHWLWRYQCAWAWSGRRGQPLALIGDGSAMRRLDRGVVVAARSDLPVHVLGASGAPLEQVAHAVHDSSTRWGMPLIETDVPALLSSSVRLRSMLLRALRGSLLIRHASAILAGELPGVFERLFAALPASLDDAAVPRLILIDERERCGDVVQSALADAALPFGGLLRIEVPSLHERSDDFDALLAHLCDRFQMEESRFTRGARSALASALDMPGDQVGFERLVARLAMVDPGAAVDEWMVGEALDRHARSARAGRRDRVGGSPGAGIAIELKPARADPPWPPDERIGDDQLAADMLDGKLDPSLHEAIRRAIAWAVEQHASDISTPDAAEAACVSSSHLAHLLKAELGTSFRMLLARVRIERARRLLVEKPNRSITDIALDVGFGDLSHFIKSFNRFTGSTPREYRRRALAFAHWRTKQDPSSTERS